MRRALCKLAMLCGALACSSKGGDTEFVVVVSSDPEVATEIDKVEVAVTATETRYLSFPPLRGTGSGQSLLPLQFSLAPDDVSTLGFTLKVTGLRGGERVVEREVKSSCTAHERRVLALHLDQACIRNPCVSPVTCRCGTCVSVEVSPASMQVYDPAKPPAPPMCAPSAWDGGPDGPDAVDDAVSTESDSKDGAAELLAVDLAALDAEARDAADAPLASGGTSGRDGATSSGGAGGNAEAGVPVGTGGAGGGTRAGGAGGAGGASSTPVLACPLVTNPENGSVVTTQETSGLTASYSCTKGYVLNGASRLLCQNGVWSAKAPTCDLVDCGSPPAAPANGESKYGSTTYPSEVTYSCLPGYTPSDQAPLVCLDTGIWSGPAPTCRPVDCLALDDPDNGSVTTDTGLTTYPSIATYACNKGFALDGGTRQRHCQSTGEWDGAAPGCKVNCGEPPAPPTNGGIKPPAGGTWVGAEVSYYCNANYDFLPGAITVAKCQVTGDWSISTAPPCVPL